ncbi:neuronal acetylcholine receptor subunit alpha-10-like isoform X2 [Dreissena polymorpha]|nr:neuronal acetylcholine receptor subunit alpha-10-like isoform X2 [Dreissena polymorpha]
MWIYEKWKDSHLTWEPRDFDGLDLIMVPATSIWLPDIYIFNIAGSYKDGFVNVTGSKVLVQPDGNVTWAVPLHINSYCSVDATFFPYDKQMCDIHFGSWIYDISQLEIRTYTESVDLTRFIVNSEFDLTKAEMRQTVEHAGCFPGDGKHSMVHLNLLLRRKTNYYDYIVIAPTINLCVLTLATFLLPCECGWKIAIGLTVFLTLYVLQLLIAENVPDTNSTPLISVFLLVVMSLNCISLIMATIIMNVKRRGLKDPPPPVPKMLLHICESCLSKLICNYLSNWKRIAAIDRVGEESVTIFPPDDDYDAEVYSYDACQYVELQDITPDASNDSSVVHSTCNDDVTTLNEELSRTQTSESSCLLNSFDSQCPGGSRSVEPLLQPDLNQNPYHKGHDNCKYNCEEYSDLLIAPLASICLRPDYMCRQRPKQRLSYRRAIKSGHTLVREQNGIGHNNDSVIENISLKYQWFFIADVIDTFAFFIYLIVMLVSIFSVLVIIPLFV